MTLRLAPCAAPRLTSRRRCGKRMRISSLSQSFLSVFSLSVFSLSLSVSLVLSLYIYLSKPKQGTMALDSLPG